MKFIFKAISFSGVFFLLISASIDDVRRANNANIQGIKDSVAEHRNKILSEYNGFIKDLQKLDPSIDLKIPVDPKDAKSVSSHDNIPGQANLPTVFAYVRKKFDLRTRPKMSSRGGISTVNRADRLEVVYMIKKKRASEDMYWCLARLQNGHEGYIPNSYLQRTKPSVQEPEPETVTSSGSFMMPISGRITSGFGGRIDPVTKKKGSFHRGIDIAARRGSAIKAAGGGVVVKAEYAGNYGKLIIIEHKKNIFTYYAHQSKFKLSKGSQVSGGSVIGYVGTTGKATGPHLHFEVRKGKKAINPKTFIPR